MPRVTPGRVVIWPSRSSWAAITPGSPRHQRSAGSPSTNQKRFPGAYSTYWRAIRDATAADLAAGARSGWAAGSRYVASPGTSPNL
jgi:hypothetical protein